MIRQTVTLPLIEQLASSASQEFCGWWASYAVWALLSLVASDLLSTPERVSLPPTIGL